MSGPFKCPDCGIWWAGYTHRCQVPATYTSSSVNFVDQPERSLCDVCGMSAEPFVMYQVMVRSGSVIKGHQVCVEQLRA